MHPLWLAVLLAAILASATGIATFADAENSSMKQPIQGPLLAFGKATTWLNSEPLAAQELRGKVVLVDFWTYSCINWLRTLPYLRAWAEKYQDHGLVIVGVHSPEFQFEKNLDNVRRAVKDMTIDYPVAVDSDHAIWRAFDNAYWPALYFIDAEGRIRHQQFGEGNYDQAEKMIQRLLTETGKRDVPRDLVTVEGRGIEAAPDWRNLQSPENYLGFERTNNFSSSPDAAVNKQRTYAAPAKLRLNHWALTGNWTMSPEAVMANQPNGRISYRFHARDLHMVMGPAAPGASVRFRVLIDGKPPGGAHGGDVDEQGNGTVSEQRLYQLIRQTAPIVDRQFEIEFLDPGVAAFSFTFG